MMRSLLLHAASTAALLFASTAAHAADAAPLQKNDIEKIIREYILTNPEILVEAMEKLQAKQAQEQTEAASKTIQDRKDEIFKNPNAPVAGNPKGDVTLVEFFDYNCGYCKHVYPTIAKLVESDKKLRIVLMELPILSEESAIASKTALAVHRLYKEKYFAFHGAVMKLSGAISPEALLEVINSLGMDSEKIKKEAEKPEIEAILAANHKLAEALGIRGTPALIVGDELIPGAVDGALLQQKIEAMRSEKKSGKP